MNAEFSDAPSILSGTEYECGIAQLFIFLFSITASGFLRSSGGALSTSKPNS